EIETHFSSRMQEMERRWLEEKAHWQKVILAKEEEIRNLRALSEKLRGADAELEKVASEKQMFERRAGELSQDLAAAQAQLKTATEREREYFSLKAELTLAREQSRMVQDRVEREMQSVRIMAKEREERLMADNERLQRDIQIVGERVRAEAEVEVRKHKSQADLAGAALQRMRAVGQALERQVATLRSQAEEASSMKRELQQLNERYKAEFVVLQRRWQDREKEIRREIEASAQKELEALKREVEAAKLVMARDLEAAKAAMQHDVEKAREELEAEKGRLRLRAQEEVQARVQRAEDQIRRQAEEGLRGKEAAIRRELEAELEARGNRLGDKLKSEIDGLRQELVAREAIEKERLLAKEAELLSFKGTLDEQRGHLAKEQEWRKSLAADMERLEREGLAHKDELRRAHEAAEEARGRLAKEEEWKRVLLQEKANLEKLVATLEGELRHKHLAAAATAPPQPGVPAPQAGGGLLGRLFPAPKPPDAPLPPPL
ncbi:MAG: hypothetical protein HY554_12485, partial [Elusimicrobia bacterium]|nr:hypothetical protein [Elusimicrobiota bacterium]